jgi:hypothetical protein
LFSLRECITRLRIGTDMALSVECQAIARLRFLKSLTLDRFLIRDEARLFNPLKTTYALESVKLSLVKFNKTRPFLMFLDAFSHVKEIIFHAVKVALRLEDISSQSPAIHFHAPHCVAFN